MAKTIKKSLLALIGLVMFASTAIGQTVNMSRWIELNVQQGQWIRLDLAGDSIGTDIKVESGTKDTILTAYASSTGYIYYYAQGSIMRVYGDVKKFSCNENTRNLTGLNASNNTGLLFIDCYDNYISNINLNGLTSLNSLSCAFDSVLTTLNVSGLDSLANLHCGGNLLNNLDISGLKKLNWLVCFSNQFSACSLDSIFHQLPSRSISDDAKIYIKANQETNPGAETCRDSIATNKNWKVLNYIKEDNSGLPIVNTSYSCPYFSLNIEELEVNSLNKAKVYPNPANNALNIECNEKINSAIIYDTSGKELFRTKETKDIDVSSLNNGIYLLRVITNKGEGSYKVIKN